MTIDLTPRETAILGALLSRSRGWDAPGDLQRFVNLAAEHVRDGFTDLDLERLHEKLALRWLEDPR